MTSLWDAIPVGVGEDGDGIEVCMSERNMVVGGEPGGGKSVALSMLVAAAALDPYAHLTLFDGKLVELSMWRGCADHFVGPELEKALEVLKDLRSDMEERYRYLMDSGRRKITREDGDRFPLRLVAIDELASFTLGVGEEKKLCAEFSNLLRDLVSRGRAAGIIVVAATQKPSSDIVPTALRDLFGFRWAMRCSTPQASDTILGSGWEEETSRAAASGAEGRKKTVRCQDGDRALHRGGGAGVLRAAQLLGARRRPVPADPPGGLRAGGQRLSPVGRAGGPDGVL